jgi:hypothetical protein
MLFHFGTRSWARVSLPGAVVSCVCSAERFAIVLHTKDVFLFMYDGVNVTTLAEDNVQHGRLDGFAIADGIGLMLAPQSPRSVFFSSVRESDNSGSLSLDHRCIIDLGKEIIVEIFETGCREPVVIRRFKVRDILPTDIRFVSNLTPASESLAASSVSSSSTVLPSAAGPPMQSATLTVSSSSMDEEGTYCILTCAARSPSGQAIYVTAVTFDTRRKLLDTQKYTYPISPADLSCDLSSFHSWSWFWVNRLVVHDHRKGSLGVVSSNGSDDPSPITLAQDGRSWPKSIVSEGHCPAPDEYSIYYLSADKDYIVVAPYDRPWAFIWTFLETSEFGRRSPNRLGSPAPG